MGGMNRRQRSHLNQIRSAVRSEGLPKQGPRYFYILSIFPVFFSCRSFFLAYLHYSIINVSTWTKFHVRLHGKVSTLFVFNLVRRSLTSLDDFFVQLPVDLHLIFEKSILKNGFPPNPFMVYFELEFRKRSTTPILRQMGLRQCLHLSTN